VALLVYDTGALLAADRRDRAVWTWHRAVLARGELPLTHAGVLGQAWRNGARQANLAHLLKSCRILALDTDLGRAAGELCGTIGTPDVIDAAIALIATHTAAVLLTSDPHDLTKLLDNLGPPGRAVELVAI
jgi:predicted nucleic acid-binding protein